MVPALGGRFSISLLLGPHCSSVQSEREEASFRDFTPTPRPRLASSYSLLINECLKRKPNHCALLILRDSHLDPSSFLVCFPVSSHPSYPRGRPGPWGRENSLWKAIPENLGPWVTWHSQTSWSLPLLPLHFLWKAPPPPHFLWRSLPPSLLAPFAPS